MKDKGPTWQELVAREGVEALRDIADKLEQIADALQRNAAGPTAEERAAKREDLQWELSTRAHFENERRIHEIASRM